MALARLILDTRITSRRKDGSYPISLRVHHKKTRYITLGYSTSLKGWDTRNGRLKKSDVNNQYKDFDTIEDEIHEKLYLAKKKIKNFGDDIHKINITQLIYEI
ncbi:MAG: outer membrane translocation and assembly module TamA, partial [Maribacter sp.]